MSVALAYRLLVTVLSWLALLARSSSAKDAAVPARPGLDDAGVRLLPCGLRGHLALIVIEHGTVGFAWPAPPPTQTVPPEAA